MSDNIRTALYDADYTVALASRVSTPPPMLVPGRRASTARAATSSCATRGCPADLAPGDLLAVAATGAYCRAMASQLQPRAAPAGRGGPRRARERRAAPRDAEDLLALDAGDLSRLARAGRGSGRTVGAAAADVDRLAARRRRRGTGERIRSDAGARRCGRAAGGGTSAEVVRLLHEQADDLAARVGAPLELVGIAVRRPARARDGVDAELCHRRRGRRWSRAGVDVVVEVIGGIEPARTLLLAAMQPASSVVTANKALLAEDGATLHAAARRSRGRPVLRGVGRRRDPAAAPAARVAGRRQGHPGARHRQRHHQLHPDPDGRDRRRASPTRWPRPQALGYAEADPTADVEGYDAAAKAAILAGLAFHTRVTVDDVHREGITAVTAADVAAATEMGYVVKLLAICRAHERRARGGRAGAPGDGAAHHPLAGGARRLQRGVRRGGGRRAS